MLIDGYVAEQIKNAMLNSEQEQVKIYDAYYNKGVTDGYNQALEDIFNLAKQNSYDDGVDYSIGLQKLDELIANIRK